MRPSIKTAIAFVLAAAIALAGIPTAATWEVRPGVGSDTNGGGFVTGATGTDFSQQNSAQVAFTDLVIGATTTQLTSVLNPFGATSPGNIINITGGAGCTTGWYAISSVATITATMDRSVGTAASVCTGNLGGALATISRAVTNSVDRNSIFVKATGTYTVSAAQTLTIGLTFTGYTSTRGDNGQVTWTTATNSIDLVSFNNANNPPSGTTFNNFIFTDTAGTPGDGFHSINGTFNPALSLSNCSLSGFNIGVLGDWQAASSFLPLTITNTEIKNSVSHGVSNAGPTQIFGSYIHGNGGDGVRITQANISSPHRPFFITQSTIYNNTGVGINNQVNQVQGGATGYGYLVIVNVNVVGNGGDGIQQTQESVGSYGLFLANSIIDSNGGFGVDQGTSAQLMAFDVNNFYRSNTSGDTNNWTKGAGSITGTADPFVSKASNNFALNNTAGGGAAAKNAGFPGVLQVGGTGSISIGALQPAGSTASQVAYAIVQ